MNFNPYMQNGQPKSPQQLQAELTAMLQGQYAPMYNAYQQQNMQAPMPNQPSTSGNYIFVNDYNEVENYPVPADGRAVLIFVSGQQVYYSKKLVNGQALIQPFTYAPLNANGTTADSAPTQEEKPQSFEDKVVAALQNLSDRMTQLENAKPKAKPTKKDTAEVRDEL